MVSFSESSYFSETDVVQTLFWPKLIDYSRSIWSRHLWHHLPPLSNDRVLLAVSPIRSVNGVKVSLVWCKEQKDDLPDLCFDLKIKRVPAVGRGSAWHRVDGMTSDPWGRVRGDRLGFAPECQAPGQQTLTGLVMIYGAGVSLMAAQPWGGPKW